MIVAVVGVLAVVALAAGTLALVVDDRSALRTRPVAVDPPTRSELDRVVAEITEVVERERGLTFLEPPVVQLADDADFEARLLEDFEDDVQDIIDSGKVLAALGLVEPGTDFVAQVRSLIGAGVVGFYDAETDELVVRGAALTPYVRSTIAHELVHALDDQHHELDRPALDDVDDESSFGFSALVEGTAVFVEEEFAKTFTRAEAQQAGEEELAVGGDTDFSAFPPILLDLILAPYSHGPDFVTSVVRAGGTRAVDDAYAAPPTTSEQFLDPDRYRAGEEAVAVEPPPADGEVFDEGAIGQYLLAQLLGRAEFGFVDVTHPEVEGWGGDWYVAWDEGERTCIRAHFVGDTAEDTAEIGRGLEVWARGHRDGSTRLVESGGRSAGLVELNACA